VHDFILAVQRVFVARNDCTLFEPSLCDHIFAPVKFIVERNMALTRTTIVRWFDSDSHIERFLC
jgi:hypothetical protein